MNKLLDNILEKMIEENLKKIVYQKIKDYNYYNACKQVFSNRRVNYFANITKKHCYNKQHFKNMITLCCANFKLDTFYLKFLIPRIHGIEKEVLKNLLKFFVKNNFKDKFIIFDAKLIKIEMKFLLNDDAVNLKIKLPYDLY